MKQTGTYAVTGAAVRSTKPIGQYTRIDQRLFIDNAGVLSGPSSADVTRLIGPTGDGRCIGSEHFDGTIGGRTGRPTSSW